MHIQINGDSSEVPADTTVARLIESLGLAPELVAVELNDGLVARDERATTRLADGDRVEIVTLVGGG